MFNRNVSRNFLKTAEIKFSCEFKSIHPKAGSYLIGNEVFAGSVQIIRGRTANFGDEIRIGELAIENPKPDFVEF